MTLGTADTAGQPWVSPVYYAAAGYTDFSWISSPEARHARNLALRPQVSIVVFDSQACVGMAQAVYMAVVTEELTGGARERGSAIYNGRVPDPGAPGLRVLQRSDLQPPAQYRLYCATVSAHWVRDPPSSPERRLPVTV